MLPELDFTESLFVCGMITLLFLALYGLVCLLGLAIIKIYDRTKKKHRWAIVRRVL